MLLFVVLAIIIFIIVCCKYNKGKEGFYNNPTAYYPGCNPLLYTQCPGCGSGKPGGCGSCGGGCGEPGFPTGCTMNRGGCWRETDICGTDRMSCPLATKDKACY